MTELVRLLDVNILISLTNPSHVHHQRTHNWFNQVDNWATTPMTEVGFIRLMLNPIVAGVNLTTTEVLSVWRELTELPGHVRWSDDTTLAHPAIDLSGLVGHKQVTDFHLVNLAAQHSGVFATLDRAIIAVLVGSDRKFVEAI